MGHPLSVLVIQQNTSPKQRSHRYSAISPPRTRQQLVGGASSRKCTLESSLQEREH